MFFRKQYSFLSTMHDCPIKVFINRQFLTFKCLESAFHAFKDPKRAEEFINLDGVAARALGKQVQLRSDWEDIKVMIMRYLNQCKFIQNKDLLARLRFITEPIVEESKYPDNTFWGVYNGVGENQLGKIIQDFKDNARFLCHANCPETGGAPHCIFSLDKMYDEYDRYLCPCGNTTDIRLIGQTCCFTGRRPKDLYGYIKEHYIPIINKLKSDIIMLYYQGYRQFITGGAQGFDQLAFWAVNAVKRDYGLSIENIVFVPFKGQELAWKETGLFSQEEYNLMLALADKVAYLNWKTTDGHLLPLGIPYQLVSPDQFSKMDGTTVAFPIQVSAGKQTLCNATIMAKRSEEGEYYVPSVDTNAKNTVFTALYDRNHSMVHISNLVYGLYPDYSWMMPQVKGGTAECLRYAKNKNKAIYQLSNETMRSGKVTY